MRRFSLAAIGLLLVFSTPAQAQQWSPEQQEVLEAIEGCWDAWNEAGQQEDYAVWSEPCLASEDAQFWWAESVAPSTAREWNRVHSMGLFGWGTVRGDWWGMRPLSIAIKGDFAFVYFAPAWIVENSQGEIEQSESKNFEVWRRVDGRWKYFGGMGAPNESSN